MMIAFHRDMIKIHKEYDFLSNGSLVFLWNDYQGLVLSEDFPMMNR